MQTGQPGTRRNPDALFSGDGSDSDECDADVRLPRGKRCHLAEFFDKDGEYGKNARGECTWRMLVEPSHEASGSSIQVFDPRGERRDYRRDSAKIISPYS